MTNYQKIVSMNIDEMAEYLARVMQVDDNPALKWFDKKYCQNCETIWCDSGSGWGDTPYAYCEKNDKCRFFPEVPDMIKIMKLWLENNITDNN